MKHIHNKAFPYPVLSRDSDDYENCAFQSTIEWRAPRAQGEDVKLLAEFRLSDDNLNSLIDAGRAEFAIEVHCVHTYTRKMVTTRGEKAADSGSNGAVYSAEFRFGAGDFYGEVITNCYIISKESIGNFSSRNFNQDYVKRSFRVEEGSVLAVNPPIQHYFDTEPEAPIGTFFRLLEDKTILDGQFGIDYEDDEYVGLCLSQKTKTDIENMRGRADAQPLLWCGFYFPALLEVLHEMQQNRAEHESKRWFDGISKGLKKSGNVDPKIDLERKKAHNLLKGTQQLLASPLGRIIQS